MRTLIQQCQATITREGMYQLKKTRSFSQKRRNGEETLPQKKKVNGIYKLNYFQEVKFVVAL
jgi:hypothetical protein